MASLANDDEKLKLYKALQHYITETNALENLLKSTLSEKKSKSGSGNSSPEFGREKEGQT